jgi:hypothetical protein
MLGAMVQLIVGAAIAVISAAIGTWYGSRVEHRQWLRDQRRIAYQEFISACQAVVDRRIERERPSDEELAARFRTLTAIRILGPRQAAARAIEYAAADIDEITVAFARFVNEAQRVLRTSGR